MSGDLSNIAHHQPALPPMIGADHHEEAGGTKLEGGAKTTDITKQDSITQKLTIESQNLKKTGTVHTANTTFSTDSKTPALPPPATEHGNPGATLKSGDNPWFSVNFLAVFNSVMSQVAQTQAKIQFQQGQQGILENKVAQSELGLKISGINRQTEAEKAGHLADMISHGGQIINSSVSMGLSLGAAARAKNNPEVKKLDAKVAALQKQKAEVAKGPTQTADQKNKLNATVNKHDAAIQHQNEKLKGVEDKIEHQKGINFKNQKAKEKAQNDFNRLEKDPIGNHDALLGKAEKLSAFDKDIADGKTKLTGLEKEKAGIVAEKEKIKTQRDDDLAKQKAEHEATKAAAQPDTDKKMKELDKEISKAKGERDQAYQNTLQTINSTNQAMTQIGSSSIQMMNSAIQVAISQAKGQGRITEAQADFYMDQAKRFEDACNTNSADAKQAFDAVMSMLQKIDDSWSKSFSLGA